MNYTEEDIIKRLGLDLIEEEMREQMLASFYDTLSTRIMISAAESLSDDKVSEFDSLASSDKSDEKLNQWMEANVPNYQNLLEAETEKLLQEIDANAADIQKGA